MPGQPIIRSQIQMIEALGDEAHEKIVDMFAQGEKVKTIARSLGPHGVSMRVLYGWLRSRPDVQAAWREAKIIRAATFADETHEISDTVKENPDAIAKAHLQVKNRMWQASHLDNETFGKAPKQQISIGNLHLTALEAINEEETQRRMTAMEGQKTLLESQKALPSDETVVEPEFVDDEPEPVQTRPLLADLL